MAVSVWEPFAHPFKHNVTKSCEERFSIDFPAAAKYSNLDLKTSRKKPCSFTLKSKELIKKKNQKDLGGPGFSLQLHRVCKSSGKRPERCFYMSQSDTAQTLILTDSYTMYQDVITSYCTTTWHYMAWHNMTHFVRQITGMHANSTHSVCMSWDLSVLLDACECSHLMLYANLLTLRATWLETSAERARESCLLCLKCFDPIHWVFSSHSRAVNECVELYENPVGIETGVFFFQ